MPSNTNSVAQRIVSLHKPYLRPIVRGKENKPVEFGAKVHKVQGTEIAWIFFGAMTANASIISQRMKEKEKQKRLRA